MNSNSIFSRVDRATEVATETANSYSESFKHLLKYNKLNNVQSEMEMYKFEYYSKQVHNGIAKIEILAANSAETELAELAESKAILMAIKNSLSTEKNTLASKLANINSSLTKQFQKFNNKIKSGIEPMFSANIESLTEQYTKVDQVYQDGYEAYTAASLELKEAEAVYEAAATAEALDELNVAKKAFSKASTELEDFEAKKETAYAGVIQADQGWGTAIADMADEMAVFNDLTVRNIWTRMELNSARLANANELILVGYEKFYTAFLTDASIDASEFWLAARAATGEITEEKNRQFANELKMLQETYDLSVVQGAGKEAFYAQCARFSAPSSREAMLVQESLWQFAESGSFSILSTGEYISIGTSILVRSVASKMYLVAESVLGPEIFTGFMAYTEVLAEVAYEFGAYFFTAEFQLFLISTEVAKWIYKHGLSLSSLEEALSYIGLSLDDVVAPELQIKLYPEYSTAKPQFETHSIVHIDALEYDEIKFSLDFWGKQYVDGMKRNGYEYKDYVPMADSEVISRVPGLYIDKNKLENDSIDIYEKCFQMEEAIDLGSLTANKEAGFGSLVSMFYPRKRDWKTVGIVRNLMAFPAYDSSLHWPNVDDGTLFMSNGFFGEKSIDVTIVKLFKNLVTTGRYGPIYNVSKVAKTREAAMKENVADLAQYLDPQPDYKNAPYEFDQWMKSNVGAANVFYYDMLLLAPDVFIKEWETDLYPYGKDDSWWDNTKRWIERDERYNGRELPITYLIEYRNDHGRFPYNKNAREAYELIAVDHITPYLYYNPLTNAGYEVKQRPSLPLEITLFKGVLETGNKYRDQMDTRKDMTKEAWDNNLLKMLWPDYVRSVKSTRTIWGFCRKYKTFLFEELQFLVNSMLGVDKAKVWKEYFEMMNDFKGPVNLKLGARIRTMADFSSLAYTAKEFTNDDIFKSLCKKFNGFYEDIVVTTDNKFKKFSGFDAAASLIFVSDFDIPIFSGSLICRIFVTRSPTIIVISFKGTTSIQEFIIDIDIVQAEFLKITHGAEGPILKLMDEPKTEKEINEMTEKGELVQVHSGFLRAYLALEPSIVKELKKIYCKYTNISSLYITGHSLGAGIGQIACMSLPRLKSKDGEFLKPNAIFFSSPNVGDNTFSTYFKTTVNDSIQVYNNSDPVVYLPPFLLPNFKVNESMYKKALHIIDILREQKNPAFEIMMSSIHAVVEGLHLPTIYDVSEYFDKDHKFKWDTLTSFLKVMAYQMFDQTAHRGDGTFIRLEPALNTYTAVYGRDIGNSWDRKTVEAVTESRGAYLLKQHELSEVIKNLENLFLGKIGFYDINAENDAAWDTHKTSDNLIPVTPVDPDNPNPTPTPDPNPTPTPDPDIDPAKRKKRKRVVDALLSGDATIIAIAELKHHHKPFSIVDGSEIKRIHNINSDISNKIDASIKARNKRKLIHSKDHTYY